MKIVYIFFGLLILFVGCKKESTTNVDSSKSNPITLDFQTGFNRDSVIIFWDEKFVTSIDSITTDPIVVLAASRKYTLNTGTHTLSVELPKDHFRIDTAFVNDGRELWVGINYNREQRKIHYLFQYSPFQYK